MARRDEGAYCRYVTEEQRSQPGLIIHHVRDVHENPAQQQILSSLVQLDRALRSLTVADGVEKHSNAP